MNVEFNQWVYYMDRTKGQEILRFYHEIGHSPVLEDWRQRVPKDVRKLWLRQMILETGVEKLTEPNLTPVIEKYITSEAQRQQLQRYKDRIAVLEQQLANSSAQDVDNEWDIENEENIDDRLAEAYLNYEAFLQSLINDEMLAEFARIYFTSFETAPQTVKKFFEQQSQHSAMIGQALKLFLERGAAILTPLTDYLRMGSYDINNKQESTTTESSIKGLVVYGSSAIGPRSKTYARGQDLDVLVMSAYPTEINQAEIQVVAKSIEKLNILMQRLQNNVGSPDYTEIVGHVQKIFPEWMNVMDYLQKNHLKIDLHTPRVLENMNQPTTDWKKLCGPHRVVYTFAKDWEAEYQQFVQKSIDSARILATNH